MTQRKLPVAPLVIEDRELYIAALAAYMASLDIRRKKLKWGALAERRARLRAEEDADRALLELKQGLL
jgi:hypothetical protein